jgi:hypothetical protein
MAGNVYFADGYARAREIGDLLIADIFDDVVRRFDIGVENLGIIRAQRPAFGSAGDIHGIGLRRILM